VANISQLNISLVNQRQDNLSKQKLCHLPVCDRLQVVPLCSQLQTPICLIEYPYPSTLVETAQVAKEADFERRVAESGIVVGKTQSQESRLSQASAEAAASARAARKAELEFENPKPKLAPFRPDWRFWTGVTLSGLGLFLYRNR